MMSSMVQVVPGCDPARFVVENGSWLGEVHAEPPCLFIMIALCAVPPESTP